MIAISPWKNSSEPMMIISRPANPIQPVQLLLLPMYAPFVLAPFLAAARFSSLPTVDVWSAVDADGFTHVNVGNSPARRLYSAAGYEQVGRDERVCRLRKLLARE